MSDRVLDVLSVIVRLSWPPLFMCSIYLTISHLMNNAFRYYRTVKAEYNLFLRYLGMSIVLSFMIIALIHFTTWIIPTLGFENDVVYSFRSFLADECHGTIKGFYAEYGFWKTVKWFAYTVVGGPVLGEFVVTLLTGKEEDRNNQK